MGQNTVAGNAYNPRGFRHDFTLMAISLMPIGIAINLVIGELVLIFKLPLFLDMIGTVIVAMVAGPWVGMITGGLTNLIHGTWNPILAAFIPVQMVMGLVVGFLSMRGMTKNIRRAIVTALIAAAATLAISVSITVMFFGGITGTGSDTITALMLALNFDMWQAVLIQKIIVESIDRIFNVLIGLWIVKKMSDRFLSKHNYGSIYMDKKFR